MEIEIVRMRSYTQCTLGVLYVLKNEKVTYTCYTLELPWKDNQPQVSCIPKGEYTLSPRKSAKFKEHFIVTPTPGRDAILIHAGNTFTDTHGCILVGVELGDINSDTIPDVTGSRKAMEKLNELIKEPVKLTIK